MDEQKIVVQREPVETLKTALFKYQEQLRCNPYSPGRVKLDLGIDDGALMLCPAVDFDKLRPNLVAMANDIAYNLVRRHYKLNRRSREYATHHALVLDEAYAIAQRDIQKRRDDAVTTLRERIKERCKPAAVKAQASIDELQQLIKVVAANQRGGDELWVQQAEAVVKQITGKLQRMLESYEREMSRLRSLHGEHCPLPISNFQVKPDQAVIAFTSVKAPYGWLGNMAPYPIVVHDKEYRTSEALFQCLRFTDVAICEEIRAQKSPMAAKMVAKRERSRMIGASHPEGPGWFAIDLMSQVLKAKLEQHPELQDWLRETGDAAIIEDCTKRQRGSGLFWGAALRDGQWVGQNWLGVLWMGLRKQLLEERQTQPSRPVTIAIIGTAGRKEDKHKMSAPLWENMRRDLTMRLNEIEPDPAKRHLVSGGAAWADHLAVRAYLDGEAAALTLHLPAEFTGSQFVDTGDRDWRTNPGRTANYYHDQFSAHLNYDTLAEIDQARNKGAELVVGQGFHDRNAKVAQADVLIAYTWGEGEEPKDGGTKDTWDTWGKIGDTSGDTCNPGVESVRDTRDTRDTQTLSRTRMRIHVPLNTVHIHEPAIEVKKNL